MSAIDPKESARYAARLFGYFLSVAIVGGAVTAGGLVLLDGTGAMPGGMAVEVGAELVVGSALTAIGALAILAGLFAIVLNVIADGVRYGISKGESGEATEAERAPSPRQVPRQDRRVAGRVDLRRPRPAPGRPESPSGERATVRRQDDEAWTDEVEDRHEDRPEGEEAEDGATSARGTADERTAGSQGRAMDRDDSAPDAEPPGGARPDRGPQAPAEPTGAGGDDGSVAGGTEESTPSDSQSRADSRGPEEPSGEAEPGEEWVSGEEVATGAESVSGEGDGQPAESGGEEPLVPEEMTEDADDSDETPAWAQDATDDDRE